MKVNPVVFFHSQQGDKTVGKSSSKETSAPVEFKYRDRLNRAWDVTLTLAGAMRVDASDFSEIPRAPKSFSILQPDKALFQDLLGNIPLMFAVIAAIVKPQMKEQLGVDPDTDWDSAQTSFIEGLDGRSISDARRAFWGTLSDFFPEQKTALLLFQRQYELGRKAVEEEVAEMEPEIETAIRTQIKDGAERVRAEIREELAGKSG